MAVPEYPGIGFHRKGVVSDPQSPSQKATFEAAEAPPGLDISWNELKLGGGVFGVGTDQLTKFHALWPSILEVASEMQFCP